MTRKQTHHVRVICAWPWLRMRDTSLATLGFSATLRALICCTMH